MIITTYPKASAAFDPRLAIFNNDTVIYVFVDNVIMEHVIDAKNNVFKENFISTYEQLKTTGNFTDQEMTLLRLKIGNIVCESDLYAVE